MAAHASPSPGFKLASHHTDKLSVVQDFALSALERLGSALVANFAQVLRYPLDPDQRLYWLYLLSSAALACVAWLQYRRRDPETPSFLRFCFPSEIWRHPSTWLDLRFFFVHQMLRVWIYGGFMTTISLATIGWLSVETSDARAALEDRAILTLITIPLLDLTAYAAHRLQHHVPLLWEFHRVHHSATILQPLTNYREHPVDNFLYGILNGLVIGLCTAAASAMLGCRFQLVDVLGVNVLYFVFNFAGYNLRHSHVWLAWPGWLGYLLGSPAHHQIHHSIDPRHVDRNFAFLFPVWDALFGTLVLPREYEPLRFGLGDGSEDEYDGVIALYALPFRRLARSARSDDDALTRQSRDGLRREVSLDSTGTRSDESIHA